MDLIFLGVAIGMDTHIGVPIPMAGLFGGSVGFVCSGHPHRGVPTTKNRPPAAPLQSLTHQEHGNVLFL